MPIARSLLLVLVLATPAAAAPPSTLGFDARLGLILPPALGAAGVSLRPLDGVSFSAYGMAGLSLGECQGCYLAGAEMMGRPRDPSDDGGYLALGAAFWREAADSSWLVAPVTGGYLWALDGIDVRLGGGLYLLKRLKASECSGFCLDFTPPALPYVEMVVTFWAL